MTEAGSWLDGVEVVPWQQFFARWPPLRPPTCHRLTLVSHGHSA